MYQNFTPLPAFTLFPLLMEPPSGVPEFTVIDKAVAKPLTLFASVGVTEKLYRDGVPPVPPIVQLLNRVSPDPRSEPLVNAHVLEPVPPLMDTRTAPPPAIV